MRAQEVGAAFAAFGELQPDSYMGFLLDTGVGSDADRNYAYSRAAYQFRVRLEDRDRGRGLAYALAGGVFVGARATLSGPGGWEGIAGVEIGGGGLLAFLSALVRIGVSG
jgi:hypothetical protein